MPVRWVQCLFLLPSFLDICSFCFSKSEMIFNVIPHYFFPNGGLFPYTPLRDLKRGSTSGKLLPFFRKDLDIPLVVPFLINFSLFFIVHVFYLFNFFLPRFLYLRKDLIMFIFKAIFQFYFSI